MKIRPVKT